MNDYEENVEKLFIQDVIEKKKVARGASHMASRKKGFKGQMMFPYEMLPSKQKKLYTQGGEVREYNMYERIQDVPSTTEIDAMEYETARKILIRLRQMHKTKDLLTHWGFNTYDTMYRHFLNKYNVPKMDNRPKTTKAGEEKTMTTTNTATAAPSKAPATPKPISKPFVGFKIMFVGNFTGEDIENRTAAMMMTLIKERKYAISMEIVEIPEEVGKAKEEQEEESAEE